MVIVIVDLVSGGEVYTSIILVVENVYEMTENIF